MNVLKKNELGPATIVGLEATRPGVDLHRRLAAAVVHRAVKDLQGKDNILALDALCWWLEDDWRWWLDMIEVDAPADYFTRLIEGSGNGN